MTRTRTGIALAFGTACISGVAVFLNGYGVRAAGDATAYTTAKNVVAAVVLIALARTVASQRPGSFALPTRVHTGWGLIAVAIVGGSVPFVLFFEGLARASSTSAAFLHKTLVVWVLLLAVPLLHERVSRLQVGAIGLLVLGQALLTDGLGSLRLGTGETLVLAATLLWSVEVVLAKRLLADVPAATVGVARMALGAVLLLGWVAVSGRADELVGLSARAWMWVLLTGLILAGYVATWYEALSRAPAVDVTAVLVFGAVITAVLARVVDDVALAPNALGLAVLTAGVALAAVTRFRTSAVP